MPNNMRNSIIFIVIVILCLFWARSCHQEPSHAGGDINISNVTKNAIEKTTETVKAASDSVSNTTNALIEKLGDFFAVKLPNGIELSIPEFGVENKLIGFIKSDTEIDKETWFEFDRINFTTGSASLSEESNEQINNIAAILNAYEDTNIKIGGYTDNTGSASANMRISQSRADAVKNALVAKGIDSARLTTEGYGQAHPIASNDTEEGRRKNRRIALRVTSK